MERRYNVVPATASIVKSMMDVPTFIMIPRRPRLRRLISGSNVVIPGRRVKVRGVETAGVRVAEVRANGARLPPKA